MTNFENQIRRAPLRTLPPEWRGEILAAARKNLPQPRGAAFLGKFRFLIFDWRNLLWPHPAAWAVLAACWILAGMLCVSGPRGESLYAVTPPGVKRLEVTPEFYATYLKARDSLLVSQPLPETPPFNRRKL